MNARTKIVATLGPATDREGVLKEMIRAGTDVVRLNLSHGAIDEHLARLRAVRDAAQRTGANVAVLADLPGPKVRTTPFPADGTELVPGSLVTIVADAKASTASVIGVDCSVLLDDLREDDRI